MENGKKKKNRAAQVKPRSRKGGKRRGKKDGRARGKRLGGMGAVLTPPKRVVELEYIQIQVLGATAHTGFGYPLQTNGAFAVDPSAPTGYATTPSFSVPATQYAAYRVRSYSGSVTFTNLTAVAADTIVCHSNTALGTASGGTVTNLLQFKANRPSINTVKAIAPLGSGANKVTHRFKHTIASIVGESIMQPGYKSLTNTVPSILSYLVFGWIATANTTAGMEVSVVLRMKVEFLDYIDTLTSFASEELRLKSLGDPLQRPMCAGCRAVSELEFAPCPDEKCSCVDMCTNCGYKRRCSLNAQSPKCPWKADTICLLPPEMTKQLSKKSLASANYVLSKADS